MLEYNLVPIATVLSACADAGGISSHHPILTLLARHIFNRCDRRSIAVDHLVPWNTWSVDQHGQVGTSSYQQLRTRVLQSSRRELLASPVDTAHLV